MTSKHADLLNALDEMQHSFHYAARRDVLRQAESLIGVQESQIDSLKATVEQERKNRFDSANEWREELDRLKAQNAELLAACKASVKYIPGSEVRCWPPGFALKREAMQKLLAVIAKYEPE